MKYAVNGRLIPVEKCMLYSSTVDIDGCLFLGQQQAALFIMPFVGHFFARHIKSVASPAIGRSWSLLSYRMWSNKLEIESVNSPVLW